MNKDSLYKNLNEVIIAERYDTFKRNLARNIFYIQKYGGLGRIIPSFKDKTVIVIGAGPSLEINYDIIKKLPTAVTKNKRIY